ncbi:MAG: hypothetical protein JWN43_3355 [Gammaproteobacteria bacterium]|nr:hypothetical protein [Gammaproteobacteria bacterium]
MLGIFKESRGCKGMLAESRGSSEPRYWSRIWSKRHLLVRAKGINTSFALLRVMQRNLERTVEEEIDQHELADYLPRGHKDGSVIDQTRRAAVADPNWTEAVLAEGDIHALAARRRNGVGLVKLSSQSGEVRPPRQVKVPGYSRLTRNSIGQRRPGMAAPPDHSTSPPIRLSES